MLRPSRVKPIRWAVLAALSLLLTAGLWLGYRILIGQPVVRGSQIVWLLGGAAMACLLVGLAVLALALPHRSGPPKTPSLLSTLVFAYVFPVAAVLLPLWAAANALHIETSRSLQGLLSSSLQPGTPWLALIQAGMLFLIVTVWFILPQRAWQKRPPLPASTWAAGLIAGLGLWLIATCATSALAGFARLKDITAPYPSSGLIVLAALTALIALPVGEEYFYRHLLVERWQARLGPTWSAVASAALFAVLQGRPLLWLPAFLFSLGLHALVQSTGHLRPAILAHSLFNLLAFILNWAVLL